MTLPKMYEPIYGQRFQILVRFKEDRNFEHCDYAKDKAEKDYLCGEYQLAYRGMGAEFKVIELPKKYWSEPTTP